MRARRDSKTVAVSAVRAHRGLNRVAELRVLLCRAAGAVVHKKYLVMATILQLMHQVRARCVLLARRLV